MGIVAAMTMGAGSTLLTSKYMIPEIEEDMAALAQNAKALDMRMDKSDKEQTELKIQLEKIRGDQKVTNEKLDNLKTDLDEIKKALLRR